MTANAAQLRVQLRALLDAEATQAADVVTQAAGGGTEYQRGGRTFAVVTKDAVEFRLNPDVAEAARRTADAGTSERGSEWVRFVPAEVDQHARDRIGAWFLSAWRAAGGG